MTWWLVLQFNKNVISPPSVTRKRGKTEVTHSIWSRDNLHEIRSDWGSVGRISPEATYFDFLTHKAKNLVIELFELNILSLEDSIDMKQNKKNMYNVF